MQGANKKTGKLLKKMKLVASVAAAAEANTNESPDNDNIHERSIVDKTSSCEPVGDSPTIGPTTLETTTNPTGTELNIMGPQEVWGKEIPREGNGEVVARAALASLVDGHGGVQESDLSVITHADGLALLDEYFPKSATGLGPLSGLLAPEPPTPPARVALPGSPRVWTTSKESEIPYPERAIDSVEACGSISNSESPGSVPSSINPTRCPSYDTNATDTDSLDVVIHPPFTKRGVFDDGPRLLEHILVALDSAYDDRRAPSSCVPGVLDEVHTTSDY
jgi:hypothetical protein